MKLVIPLMALLFTTQMCRSQGTFETKIIIVNSFYYAMEIENQAARLHIGRMDEPMDSAIVYALPAGTKRRNANFLPFSWDLFRDTIYAINFTEHPQNNRLTSLKSIPLSSLRLFDSSQVQQQLIEAARMNSLIMNIPLKNTISKYRYMDNLFFDLVLHQEVLYQFICVDDELTVWKYSHGKWEQSETIPFEAHQYFLAYVKSGQILLINAKGQQFIYDGQLKAASLLNFPLSSYILVNNRDTGEISYINRNVFDDTSSSLQSILEKHNKN